MILIIMVIVFVSQRTRSNKASKTAQAAGEIRAQEAFAVPKITSMLAYNE